MIKKLLKKNINFFLGPILAEKLFFKKDALAQSELWHIYFIKLTYY